MSEDNQKQETNVNFEDVLIDTSISDAKWLLGSVATLGMFVLVLGLVANSLAA